MTQVLLVFLVLAAVATVVLLVVLLTRAASSEKAQERTERSVREEFQLFTGLQKDRLDTFSREIEKMRGAVEEKLELMRETVDEKLHKTLEERLGRSFKHVSEWLERVHKGLGEMQSLASGVGDLKKILSNVKTRGTWGEIQLGQLLEQVLAPEQFARDVRTKKDSGDHVEFAIRLPGREAANGDAVWLPIDSKFNLEYHERLLKAQDEADPARVESAAKELEARIKEEAKAIRDKYIDPPHTTDFGILYLPIESLYAEVLRRPGLCEALQRDFRVVLAGPTTLAALLNSLQLGFRTLAIEKRTSEVWTLLGAIKTEFGKFGGILEKTHKKLQEASNTLEDAAKKTRTIERKLKGVQELPVGQAVDLLDQAEETEEEGPSNVGNLSG